MLGPKPITYGYHSCRPDLDDFVGRSHWAHTMGKKDRRARVGLIIAFVAHGSGQRSPFFHMSTTMDGAYQYARLGQNLRGEKVDDQIFLSINLWDMYLDKLLTEDNIFDISTPKAQQRTLGVAFDDWDKKTGSHLNAVCKNATKAHELLYCWRGQPPPHIMQK